LEGVPVEYRKNDETIHDRAFLIDFENIVNNSFLAVNQFTIQGTKRPRRLDVACFINGLPIAVLELKSPDDENVDI
jgi:type I restriction enzyme R subunit